MEQASKKKTAAKKVTAKKAAHRAAQKRAAAAKKAAPKKTAAKKGAAKTASKRSAPKKADAKKGASRSMTSLRGGPSTTGRGSDPSEMRPAEFNEQAVGAIDVSEEEGGRDEDRLTGPTPGGGPTPARDADDEM